VINILDALDDSQVFQPLFRTHSTWSTWRALEQEDLRQRGSFDGGSWRHRRGDAVPRTALGISRLN
jgi:hypothetical protein